MSDRIPISSETQKNVLTQSLRRCCICFGLHRDYSIKPGQIAHLDQNASNNNLSNLAYLCLPHHAEYDSRTSTTKNFTIDEVKSYRDSLLTYNLDNSLIKQRCLLSLKIDRDYEKCTESELQAIVKSIMELSRVGDGVRVVGKERGCILVTLEMTLLQAQLVMEAIRNGKLQSENIVSAKLLGPAAEEEIGLDEWLELAGGTAIRKAVSSGSGRGGMLYVGNLSFSITSDILERLFSQFGIVESALVVTDRETGRSRGFGFVKMKSGLDAALELHSTELHGRRISVNEARPRGEGGGGYRGTGSGNASL